MRPDLRAPYGERRLFPPVSGNLGALVDPDEIQLLQKHHRVSRHQLNHLLLALGPVLDALAAGGIRAVCMKGLALNVAFYRTPGDRGMRDADVLVPEARADEAAATLERLGWRPLQAVPAPVRPMLHGIPFADGQVSQLDLHRHILWNDCRRGSDDAVLDRARPIDLQGTPSFVLDGVDLLLQVCVGGCRNERIRSMLWIVDAFRILEKDVSLDWDLVVEETRRRRLAIPMRLALEHLAREWDAPIPPRALVGVSQLRVSRVDRAAFQARQHPSFSEEVRPSIVRRWHEHWPTRLAEFLLYLRFDAWRCLGSTPSPRRIGRYLDLLRWRWGLPTRGRVLRYLASLVVRRGGASVAATLRRSATRSGGRP